MDSLIETGGGSVVASFDPIEKIPIIGKFWKYIKCIRNTSRITELKNQCMQDYRAACDADILSDECQEFMDGTGYPSDAINNCIKKKIQRRGRISWKAAAKRLPQLPEVVSRTEKRVRQDRGQSKNCLYVIV